MSNSATLWTEARQASLSITNTQSLLKLRFIESVMPSTHLILCRLLLLLPSVFSSISSNESALRIRQPKYWSFSFNIRSSNQYWGLISFRMGWLRVQGTLKSLLQHHSSNSSILQHSAFFIVQLSHPHMTTGKIIALTRWTFVVKVMSLHFNMLSRLVITFLPSSKHPLISWLQSPSAAILEPPKIFFWCVNNEFTVEKSENAVKIKMKKKSIIIMPPNEVTFNAFNIFYSYICYKIKFYIIC